MNLKKEAEMKKTVILTILLLFLFGCADRQALISRFQEAYPHTWQQKLLEYDIEQKQIERSRFQQALWNLENIQDQQRERKLRESQIEYYNRPYKVDGILHIPSGN